MFELRSGYLSVQCIWLYVFIMLGKHFYSDFAPVLCMDYFDIQATVECGNSLKGVHDKIRTCSQRQRTEKYS